VAQANLTVGAYGLVTLTSSWVGASGGPSPQLLLHLTARASLPDVSVQLVQLQARVQSDSTLITIAEPVAPGAVVFGTDSGLTFEGPLARAALHFMDGQFRAQRSTFLNVEFRGLLNVKNVGIPGKVPGVDAMFNPGEWRLWQATAMSMLISVSRDEWLEKVMKVIEPTDYMILEVPIPTVPNRSRFQKALAHLKTADEHFEGGNDPGVLQSCYAAFDSLEGAPKEILAKLDDNEKRKQVDELLLKAKVYLNAGRHVSKTGLQAGEFYVDHRDAEFALGMTKMMVSYVARLLAS
jgi:hypothetical protein